MLSAVFTIGALGCHSGSPGGDSDGMMSHPADMANAGGDTMGAAQSLIGGGLLEAVSVDQTLLAYLPSATTVNRVSTGSLVVSPLPVTGANTAVANNAYDASFGSTSNSTLVYYSGPTAATDAGSIAVYGAVNVWQPSMSAGIQLSTGFVVLDAIAADHSALLFFDSATASNQGTGKVVLARIADCTATACAPQSLASGVTVYELAMSPDGKYGAYTVKNAGPPVSYGVNLVTIATGAVSTIASAGTSGSISFSPDGSLLASVGPAGALQVTSTAGGAAASWGAMPAGSKSFNVSFADSATLLVRGEAAGATMLSIYKTTATAAATAIASGPNTLTMMVPRSSNLPSGSARYLFTSMTPANGAGDVEAFDLMAATPTAIPVATAAGLGSIAINPDQTYVRVLESYDTTARRGTLTLVALPGGMPTTLATGVAPTSLSFVAMHALLYIDHNANNTLTEWRDGSSTTYATGVSEYRVRANALYFSNSAADTIYGYAPGIYVASF
jgi:hypothetical protein